MIDWEKNSQMTASNKSAAEEFGKHLGSEKTGLASKIKEEQASSGSASHVEFADDVEAVQVLANARDRIIAQFENRIVGQKDVIDLLLITLFAGGHSLLVGVPGLAKTMLISTLSQVLELDFNRIQFTPDLMPSDITGTDILEEDHSTGKRNFRYIKGPVFTNILLADEINRTPPKTQAALLQCMQEHRVTAGGVTRELALPFHVFATQNPIEQEGTYPLPEAQLDRFMFQIMVNYPSFEEEVSIVTQTTAGGRFSMEKVLTPEQTVALQQLVLRVPVAEHVVRYAVSLVHASRPSGETAHPFVKEYVAWGAGPRASQFLVLGAKARAVLNGRFTAEVEDVKALAPSVLRHRVLVNFHGEAEGINSSHIVNRLLEAVKVQ